jgi:hypothetical protein
MSQFVLDVFNACCLLHNLILGRREIDVKEFMHVIKMEIAMENVNDASNGFNHGEKNVWIQGKKTLKGTSSYPKNLPCIGFEIANYLPFCSWTCI